MNTQQLKQFAKFLEANIKAFKAVLDTVSSDKNDMVLLLLNNLMFNARHGDTKEVDKLIKAFACIKLISEKDPIIKWICSELDMEYRGIIMSDEVIY